jgi:hypothetical protein
VAAPLERVLEAHTTRLVVLIEARHSAQHLDLGARRVAVLVDCAHNLDRNLAIAILTILRHDHFAKSAFANATLDAIAILWTDQQTVAHHNVSVFVVNVFVGRNWIIHIC